MHVRCPHCHNPIELVNDAELSDIVCSSFGSSFSLLGEETISHQKAEAKTIGHFDLVEQVGIGAFGSVWKNWPLLGESVPRTVDSERRPRNGELVQYS